MQSAHFRRTLTGKIFTPAYPLQILWAVLSLTILFPLLGTPISATPISATPSPMPFQSKVEQPHVIVELVTEHTGVTPGVIETVGLKLTPDQNWHLYWQNPGDSGAAPQLAWQIDGQSVDVKTLWPVPERIPFGPLVNFGYSSEVTLLANLPIPTDAEGKVVLQLDAEWLVCQEECIPGNAELAVALDIYQEEAPKPSPDATRIEYFRKRLPVKGENSSFSLEWSKSLSDSTLLLSLPKNLTLGVTELSFFPFADGALLYSEQQKLLTAATEDSKEAKALELPASPGASGILNGILVATPTFPDGSFGQELSLPIPKHGEKEVEQDLSTNPSLLLMLLTACLGGIILNLMPCVFPILSIKILSFVHKAGKDSGKVRLHGLSFGAGILTSFWILAIIIRTFREAGESLGWGFQLQHPTFVIALTILLVSVALNLFGVFEFGSNLQRLSGSLEKNGESYSNSFLSGILATLLATPCTAPFMGSAIAYAIQAPFIESWMVFTALGVGLASPYLLLTFFPKLLSSLPRPGAWMQTLREFMGFPMLLTALWLIWVFEQQTSTDGAFRLIVNLTLFSFALWIYGKLATPAAPRLRQRLALLMILLALYLTFSFSIAKPPLDTPSGDNALRESKGSAVEEVDGIFAAPSEKDSYGQIWYTYSPDTVNLFLAKKLPVFIDFTAAWCVTCQVNKRVVFGSEEVRKKVKEKNVILVKGDWTNQDPVITEALERFDRLGVPLNVLYNPSQADLSQELQPVVFPALLTPQLVLSELEKL